MMALDTDFAPWRTVFGYGEGGDATMLVMELPVRPWLPETSSVGGRMLAASGVGAGYVVHYFRLLNVTLRFMIDLWPAIEAWFAWAHGENSFTWYPDANDLGTSYEVYLHSPEAGQPVRPTRSADYPRMFELSLTLRRGDDTSWSNEYFILGS